VTRHRALEFLLVSLVVVALATSGGVLWTRSLAPQGAPEVELVFRLEAVYESAYLRGVSADDLLDAFREAGVTTLAVEAKSLSSLERSGQVVIVPDYATGLQWVQVRAGGGLTSAEQAELAGWLAEELPRWAPCGVVIPGGSATGLGPGSFGVAFVPRLPVLPRGKKAQVIPPLLSRPLDAMAEPDIVQDLVLGISPLDVELARRHGFIVAAVLPNRPGITTEQSLHALAGLGDGQGFSAVRFEGPSALGWPDPEALAAVGRRLAELGVPFVVDKPQAGLDVVAEAAGWRGVRQHPVWTRVEPGRFPEVAREWRATFLYFEDAFFEGFPTDWLGDVKQAVRDIAAALEREGLQLGQTVPLSAYQPPRWAVAVAISGIAAATALGGVRLLARPGHPAGRWGPRRLRVGLALAFAALGGLALAGGSGIAVGLKVLAVFVAGLVFPLLGIILVLDRSLGRGQENGIERGDEPRLRPRSRLWPAIGWTVLAASLPVAGGLLGLAAASDTAFMLYLRSAFGVKLSLIATMLAAAFLFLGMGGLAGLSGAPPNGTTPADPGRPTPGVSILRRGLAETARLMRERATFGQMALLAVFALAVLVLVMRSGNFPLLPLASAETKFRSFLQEVLLVRPRTKEFLVGWPALVALLYWGRAWLAAPWRRRAALVLSVMASVGLLSVANTFAHLHIPVWFSLIRTANGLILGLPLGLLAAGLAGLAFRLSRRFLPSSEGESTPCDDY